jgi:hypothetical protein
MHSVKTEAVTGFVVLKTRASGVVQVLQDELVGQRFVGKVFCLGRFRERGRGPSHW